MDSRIKRVNELGFDVEELDIQTIEGGHKIRLRVQVVEPGHHRRRLEALTGLDVQENQARRLLNDLDHFRAWQGGLEGRAIPEREAAQRWLEEVYRPTLAAIPPEQAAKLDRGRDLPPAARAPLVPVGAPGPRPAARGGRAVVRRGGAGAAAGARGQRPEAGDDVVGVTATFPPPNPHNARAPGRAHRGGSRDMNRIASAFAASLLVVASIAGAGTRPRRRRCRRRPASGAATARRYLAGARRRRHRATTSTSPTASA